jgi:hypothetical protein
MICKDKLRQTLSNTLARKLNEDACSNRHWVVRTAQAPYGDPEILKCRWPGHQHGNDGCRPGFQYPSAMWIASTGEMMVAYSINKEDIAVTKFPLSLLGG